MKKAFLSLLLVLLFLPSLMEDTRISFATEEIGNRVSTTSIVGGDLGQSIEKTLEVEQENLRQLREQFDAIQNLKEATDRELDAYKLQVSVYGNLLLLPTSEVADLEKARVDHKAALDAIAARLESLREKQKSMDRLLHQTDEKYMLDEKQLGEIKVERRKDSLDKMRINQFEALVNLISSQRKTIAQILDVFSKRVSQFEQTQQTLASLTERFDQEIRNRKKRDLFNRKGSPLASLGWKSINEEVGQLAAQVTSLFAVNFWLKQTQAVWTSGGFSLLTFLILFAILYLLFIRLRNNVVLLQQRPVMSSRPWASLTLKLIQRSLLLLGVTVFLYTYAQVRLVYSSVSLIRLIVYVLVVWLFCRWELDLLEMLREGDKPAISESMVFRLRLIIFSARAFAIAYLTVTWMIGKGGVILFLSRVSFEVAFLIWSVSFWKMFSQEFGRSSLRKSRLFSTVTPLITGLGYTIAGGGFLVELAGYGKLALYWYTSWGRTVVVLSWASLLFLSLREWNAGLAKGRNAGESGQTEKTRPVKWLIMRLSWLAWMGILVVSLLFAWGATHTVIVGLVRALGHPIQIGNMRLSLVGFLYAVLILLFTHATTRLWRQFLRNRILLDSGLELGVQESVTTITVYLFWGLGILVSLNVMGLSATSIAVAFGALSIGLGFGLQNIFNNFVSGLILLFERPIQVGDVVQVNEIWGTVTKINVRSTVVQTYDNASLIIPNSEMISNKVTNWSFKDPRLRRNITVGVAYGSNTELVRETLLEIAKEHPKVLKKPKPDVLFDDFGDSALVFRLRLWTTIDHFIAVETEVRLAIDRLFRERNIEIAFPQRDIHIRSVVEKTKFNVVTGE